jgi:hypothetical protein
VTTAATCTTMNVVTNDAGTVPRMRDGLERHDLPGTGAPFDLRRPEQLAPVNPG